MVQPTSDEGSCQIFLLKKDSPYLIFRIGTLVQKTKGPERNNFIREGGPKNYFLRPKL
jgi:hypothetical protein